MADSKPSRAKYQIQVGDKFGRLTVTGSERRFYNGRMRTFSLCVCECGAERSIVQSSLFRGLSKSCGCLSSDTSRETHTTHGKSSSPEYAAWYSMKKRCYGSDSNKRNKKYRDNQIAICQRWLESWENFLQDMGSRPSPRHSVDRIDNLKGYEPANCRWAIPKIQARNTSRNSFYEWNGRRLTLPEWSELVGISARCLRDRIVKLNWPIDKALTTPQTEGKYGVRFVIWPESPAIAAGLGRVAP